MVVARALDIGVAEDRIGEEADIEGVRCRGARQAVRRPGPADDLVVARTALDDIVVDPAVERVVARAAEDRVVVILGEDEVIPIAPRRSDRRHCRGSDRCWPG